MIIYKIECRGVKKWYDNFKAFNHHWNRDHRPWYNQSHCKEWRDELKGWRTDIINGKLYWKLIRTYNWEHE